MFNIFVNTKVKYLKLFFVLLHVLILSLPISSFAKTFSLPKSPSQLAFDEVVSQNSWLKENQNKIELIALRESEIGYHIVFTQKHQNITVYGGNIKVNLAKNNQILSIFSALKPIHALLPASQFVTETSLNDLAYYLEGGKWQLVKVLKIANSKGEMEEHIFDVNGKLLQQKALDLFVGKDTLVKTKVFNPDPLATAQKIYGQGGFYKHNNGADAPELTAELKTVDVTLLFKNDTFFSQSPYAIISDLEAPTQNVFQSKIANFNFTRSKSEFREMNCLYHIERLRKYLKTIGFPFDSMFVIQVDPTAYQGQDQSRFSYSNLNPSLFFGTGGVPDAEDADVIVHEYAHGINFFIAPNSLGSMQRLSIEEANCDFMACQYSKALSNYNWRWVFNWDGHNEFWLGRDANSPNVYPKDVSSDVYGTSAIWSSMLNDLSDDLGREITTKLLLTSIYSYSSEMNMQDAADLLMQADSLLYGFGHASALKVRLEQRGFSVVTSLNKIVNSKLNLKIYDSENFAKGISPITIQQSNGGLIQGVVYNINGQVVVNAPSFSERLVFYPTQLPLGIYFVSINDDRGNSKIIKVIRLE
jgi:hypothetical protein